MLKHIASLLLALPLLAFAAPKNWTLPANLLYSDGLTTLSGTFTYDESTGIVTNPNIVASGSGAVNQTFNFAGDPSPIYAFFQTAQTVSGSPACLAISMVGSDSATGTYTTSFVYLYTGNPVGGLCTSSASSNFGSQVPATFTISAPVTTAAIPTLSEWAMILLASLMAFFTFRTLRRK
jgi:hypothetical protein